MVLRRGSGLPVYLQVVDQLRYLITAGRYRPGDYLPPMRQVAEELGLNLNTILRAYAELQRDGLIQSTRGKGAVVRPAGTATADINRLSERGQADSVDAMIYASVEHALSAGLDPAMILARTQRALDAVGKRAPVGPLLALLMTIPWRANVYAEALRSVGIGRVRPISTWEEAVGCDLVIRPTFGSADPVPPNVGAPTLDVALLLDRRSLREVGRDRTWKLCARGCWR
ncbi:MAG: GntR family transcriptional regulator [Blastocatellia bacterium]|nr:GntR family transcriptional regulator [Blastocatellia bacterium]